MLGQRHARRPNVGEILMHGVYGDCKILKVHGGTGVDLTISTPRHGVERVGRAVDGWWIIREPIAWGGWNQGFYPSVRKAVRAAAEWLNHPDNPGHDRLWIVRHDTRPGWRLVNCGSRGPGIEAMNTGFHGPFTAANIAAKRKDYKA